MLANLFLESCTSTLKGFCMRQKSLSCALSFSNGQHEAPLAVFAFGLDPHNEADMTNERTAGLPQPRGYNGQQCRQCRR